MNTIKSLLIIGIFGMLLTACESGPTSTENGYQYDLHTKGSGKKAAPGDYVYFEMQIKKEDGTVMQDMTNLPKMPVAQVPEEGGTKNGAVNPVIDILSISSVGDSVTIFIPIDSIPRPPANVEGEKAIHYTINIRDIVDKAGYEAKMAEENAAQRMAVEALKVTGEEVKNLVGATLDDYKSGKIADKLVKLPSGLEYIIHEEGTGPIPNAGQKVTAHYYGIMKSDGSMFDNSYRAGKPFSFNLGTGGVIKGWDVGFAQLKKGTKATLFIPFEMAYGKAGRSGIPPSSDLVFHVELVDIN